MAWTKLPPWLSFTITLHFDMIIHDQSTPNTVSRNSIEYVNTFVQKVYTNNKLYYLSVQYGRYTHIHTHRITHSVAAVTEWSTLSLFFSFFFVVGDCTSVSEPNIHSHTADRVVVLEDRRNYVQGFIHKILHLLAHCISQQVLWQCF